MREKTVIPRIYLSCRTTDRGRHWTVIHCGMPVCADTDFAGALAVARDRFPSLAALPLWEGDRGAFAPHPVSLRE